MRHVVLIILIFLLVDCENNTGQFLLFNQSGQTIAQANILIGNESFEFTNILVGDESAGTYEVLVDSHYKINIMFESGKKIEKSIGYITSGFDYGHRIVITAYPQGKWLEEAILHLGV